MMRGLSLFAGIGGIDLSLHLAMGDEYVTSCYVEIDGYCQRVLSARMSDGFLTPAPIFGDVTTFDGRPWNGYIDIIHGGFPCTDISVAGKNAGIIHGKQSGLWREFARIVGEV
jgi:DNA (cytosine-5)-methyltransferase 1